MTILEALMAWAGRGTPPLDGLLVSVGNLSPDLKPTADAWLAKLGRAVTPEGLAEVALALPGEARDILRGKLAPEDRPSDFA